MLIDTLSHLNGFKRYIIDYSNISYVTYCYVVNETMRFISKFTYHKLSFFNPYPIFKAAKCNESCDGVTHGVNLMMVCF